MKPIYSLYVNKIMNKLTITKLSEKASLRSDFEKKLKGCNEDEYVQYNEYYYTSYSRKSLKELALEIKGQWINDLEDKLNTIKNIKI